MKGEAAMAFVEVTTATMNPEWMTHYPGQPGTIAHQLGGTWWCIRSFATGVTRDHVCEDIERGGRRWVWVTDGGPRPSESEPAPALVTPKDQAGDIIDRIDSVLDGYVYWHGDSEDAANSAADDHLDCEYEHPCLNCGWGTTPGDGPHDCEWGYQPDLPAEQTGEFAIFDWYEYQNFGHPFFAAAAEAAGDAAWANEEVWVLAAYAIKPGADEGEYQPQCEPTTIENARKLAQHMDIGCLIGD
jgi:hypothetical protein